MPVTSVIKHKYSGLQLSPPTYRTENTGSNSWNNKNQFKSISARNLQGTVGLLNSSPSWWGRMTCCRCWTSYWSRQHTICSEIPSPLRPLSSPDQRSDIVLPGSPRELQPRNLKEGEGWGWVDGPEDILRSNLKYRSAYEQVAGWPN